VDEIALAPGETAESYQTLVDEIVAALKPRDVIGRMMAQDIGDWEWRKRRYKRLEAGLLASEEVRSRNVLRPDPDVLYALMSGGDYDEANSPASEEQKRAWKAEIAAMTEQPAVRTPEEVKQGVLNSYQANSNELDKLSRSVALAESRQNALLREYQRYTDSLYRSGADEEVIDAEFSEVPRRLRIR